MARIRENLLGDGSRVDRRILPDTRPRSYDAITPTRGPQPTAPISPGEADRHIIIVPNPSGFVADKSLLVAYILCFPLGFLGLHHFYLGRPLLGVVYVFTFGVGGLGWLIDFFRMPCLVRDANWRLETGWQRVSKIDLYLMWLPFGMLGLHHYYLRRRWWGLLYTFTVGMYGVGWLIDGFRIPSLVQEINSRRLQLERDPQSHTPEPFNLWDLYTLCLSPPFGINGAHHFYLGRSGFGFYYWLTCGGCGVGWVVDWFRLKCLVDRVNHPERYPLGCRQKFVDDAYILAFPFGLLGLHHFYLERPGWGVLYLFTGGLLGVGWLVDLLRMPCLVDEVNERLISEHVATSEVVTSNQGQGQGQGRDQVQHSDVVTGVDDHRTPVSVGGVLLYGSVVAHPWGSFGEPPTVQPPPYAIHPNDQPPAYYS